jgi:probable phosphoglycerate mutase
MTELWVMRHGETEWNTKGLLQGHADSPLTARGAAQARSAGELLRAAGIRRLIASDLGRARQTAAIVAEVLGLAAAADPAWRELDVGPELEGRPQTLLRSPDHVPDPARVLAGGESMLLMRERVLAALGRLLADPLPTLVVTHAGPLRVLAAESEAVPPLAILDYQRPRSLLVRFSVRDGRLGGHTLVGGDERAGS